ncbi:MAG TPA: IS256 family transposase [Candidatus Tyrphobacter sp.]
MKRSYPTSLPSAKYDQAAFVQRLEILCRVKLSELFQAVLEAEVDEALERVRYERRGDDGATGYRDGHDRPRTISSNRGPITIARPRVRGTTFTSAVLPKHRRKLENVDRSVTDLWLDGLATRDFEGTLRAFLGAEAPLSAATIARTNQRLCADLDAWNARRLGDLEVVFVWADGVYLGAGPDDERRVFLTVIGADRMGRKHLIALREAMSESEVAWEELFADLASRGLRAPALLVADGANGLWAAASKAWPRVAQQRCWLHKMRNVEDKLPKSQQQAARDAMGEIMYLESEPEARRKWERLARSFERAYPKAAKCMRDDVERLFAYYQFPASTWYHLRTTNAIESIFAPIRHRTDAMKRLRTGRFATAVVLALIGKLSRKWRRLQGYRDIYEIVPTKPSSTRIALKHAA